MNTLTHEEAAHRRLGIAPNGVFEGLTSEQLADLESMGVYMEYDRELVAAEGHELGYFFYIIEGRFEVSMVDPETRKKCILANIRSGECFGEMSFLSGSPASANVMALDRVVAWAIPHSGLRQFLESHSGGAHLAIRIATLLAHRVQDGNTRLLGINSTLSAYFGHAARTSTAKSMRAPQTAEHAEMELSDEIFDQFARETLKLPNSSPLTNEQRESIRSRIESNELDIVPWLEQSRGQALKVRLKFISEEAAPRVAVATSRPAATPTQATIVRVPQVRARMAPQIAYVPGSGRSAWRWINLGCWLFLPVLTAYVLFHLMPLESREAIAESEGVRKLPMHGVWNFLMFQSNSKSEAIGLKKEASYSSQTFLPKMARMMAVLKISNPGGLPLRIQAKIRSSGSGKDPVLDKTVEIPAKAGFVELYSIRLPPGNYELAFQCMEGPSDAELPSILVLSARY